MLSPADVEIVRVGRDDIYDLYVNGRFKNYYATFAEAALAAEEIIHKPVDVVRQWRAESKNRGGKVHR